MKRWQGHFCNEGIIRQERFFIVREAISWLSGGQITKGWSMLSGQWPWKGFLYDEDPRAVDKSKCFHGPLGVAIAGTPTFQLCWHRHRAGTRALQSDSRRQLTLKHESNCVGSLRHGFDSSCQRSLLNDLATFSSIAPRNIFTILWYLLWC